MLSFQLADGLERCGLGAELVRLGLHLRPMVAQE